MILALRVKIINNNYIDHREDCVVFNMQYFC